MIETREEITTLNFNPGIIYLKGKIFFLRPHFLDIYSF